MGIAHWSGSAGGRSGGASWLMGACWFLPDDGVVPEEMAAKVVLGEMLGHDGA